MPTPSWIQDAIFYQIFPDRFRNGDKENDPPVVFPWNTCATPKAFHGGDLRGIAERMDYLVDLGINALYLNPIFLSPSNHRYNTVDYYTIDPKLGTMADFRHLIEVAHRHEIRVVLDGVFNHCGRGFFAFSDVLENGEDSPYKDWFHIKKFPLDAYSGKDANYLAWWGFKSLPKLNTRNPRVRKYIMDVARYWIEQGADGWRLDVPNEIDDDDFWAEFRQVVRAANPEAYLVGEIWEALPRWVGEGHFDGLMNYPLRSAVLGLLVERWTPTRFSTAIDRLIAAYPRDNTFAMLVLLGSHDTERILTMTGGSVEKAKLAAAIQFAYPGAPSIYYGDEIGLEGGKDPACRSGFPWDQTYWNMELRDWYRRLTGLRRDHTALRRGDYLSILSDDASSLVAFARMDPHESILVAFNASSTTHAIELPVDRLGWEDGRLALDLLGGGDYIVTDQRIHLTLPGWSGVWLK